MTFSLAGYCPDSGLVGVAVTSSSPAVAARCAHVGVSGAAVSQNLTDPELGRRVLTLLTMGAIPKSAIKILEADKEHMEYRQLLVVNRKGQSAGYTGKKALGKHAGHAAAKNVAAGGNLLATAGIPEQMVDTFSTTRGHIGSRLLGALRAGVELGGEEGAIHSAGLLIKQSWRSWPIVDLRVDWTDSCPVTQLEQLWEMYEPQIDDYIMRAESPQDAPKYGVPGEA